MMMNDDDDDDDDDDDEKRNFFLSITSEPIQPNLIHSNLTKVKPLFSLSHRCNSVNRGLTLVGLGT